MLNCVTGTPLLEPSGTYSVAASRVMTTPAACVGRVARHALDGQRGLDQLVHLRVSFVEGLRSGETSSARRSVILSSIGISLATLSTSWYGMP